MKKDRSSPFVNLLKILYHLVDGAFFHQAEEEPSRFFRRMRSWCQKSLGIFHVHVRVTGEIPGDDRTVMLVANHISWMDPAVLGSIRPARFIGKSEITTWPLIGRLAKNSRSFFVKRDRPESLRASQQEIRQAFQQGDSVALFAEGTTSDGKTLMPFRKGLFNVPIEAGASVIPVLIRYETPEGEREEGVAFIGEMTFLSSLWRVARLQTIIAHLHFCPAIETTGEETLTPGTLSTKCRGEILGALHTMEAVPRREAGEKRLCSSSNFLKILFPR